MNNKLRQVTDRIHGTIYLSALESEFISTPYFYRLHDIYQSSTVYMTYPSNRTKRYEHSLGTMEIVSAMLFSGISNADKATKEKFFDTLISEFKRIFDGILNFNNENATYLQKASEPLNDLFGYVGQNPPTPEEFIKNEIRAAYRAGMIHDSALDQFQFYAVSTIQTDRNYSGLRDSFLYRCVLEAIRLVALFHDVGHPPYSHIIEYAINDIYDEVQNNPKKYKESSINEIKKHLDPFKSKDARKAFQCKMILSQESLIKAETHERIGLALLQNAINDVLPQQIKEIYSSNLNIEAKRVFVTFDIVVAEMSLAILTEISPFYESLHKLVDGYVDADRLDYVVRDSVNSGVDWGTVPYKRLIQACKFFYLDKLYGDKYVRNDKHAEEYFGLAFPKKNADDISDMLVTRYKIFARINFHHRCIKTGSTLKDCVKALAFDYLTEANPICEEISMLWKSLEVGRAGNIGMRIIQWNDSWLISLLHKALVNVQGKAKYSSLRENLEEILLNKKLYYSLLKRGDDQREFVVQILREMGVKAEDIDKLNDHEEEKLKRSQETSATEGTDEDGGNNILTLFNDEGNALDSLGRMDLYETLVRDGDLALLGIIFPLPKEDMEEVFRNVLKKAEEENTIKGYQIYINKGRDKLGLPRHEEINEEIFLYNGHGFEKYNENHSVKGQLESIQNSVPAINVYFIPNNKEDAGKIGDEILNTIVKNLGKEYNERSNELFGGALQKKEEE